LYPDLFSLYANPWWIRRKSNWYVATESLRSTSPAVSRTGKLWKETGVPVWQIPCLSTNLWVTTIFTVLEAAALGGRRWAEDQKACPTLLPLADTEAAHEG
jgi:hypothetical protein